jgi:hypothetical protein
MCKSQPNALYGRSQDYYSRSYDGVKDKQLMTSVDEIRAKIGIFGWQHFPTEGSP